jgi:hypothetical protein
MIHFTKNVEADLTVFLHKKINQPTLDTTSTFAIEIKECQEQYTTMVKIAVVGGTGSMQPPKVLPKRPTSYLTLRRRRNKPPPCPNPLWKTRNYNLHSL